MSADYLLQVFSLTGKTAILTGATGGLGTSLALALAKAGASIVSIEIPDDPNSDALKKTISEEAGSSVRNFTCDVAKTADLRACYASIWDAGIIPDILVNCAGVARQNACEDVTDDDMDLVNQQISIFIYANVQFR
jgi:2-deoxy-D-gluconate 3-dehydrogenase